MYVSAVADRPDSHTTAPEQTASTRAGLIPVILLTTPGRDSSVPGVIRIPAAPGAVVIGRGAGRAGGDPAELGLADPLLSRRHMQIGWNAGRCEVVDEGSLNGTLVDGRRLGKGQAAPLSDGSILCFGKHAAVFRRVSPASLAALEEDQSTPFGPVPTSSPALAASLAILRRLATSDAEILLLGETGVGKDVYARAVHRLSGRKGPFVAVNCAAIPVELGESELFGYARGAHSTATDAKAGLIQAAQGGTLFLDEIGDTSPRLQTKLLRFLQDREVRAVGATRGAKVDVRIVAATHEPAVGPNGTLRADVVGRLGAEAVTILALRHRIEDLGHLIGHFAGARAHDFEAAALRAMFLYAWPRNVRELESVVERALLLAGERPVAVEHLPEAVRKSLRDGPPIEVTDRRRPTPSPGELKLLLEEHEGNVSAVARTLDRRWNVVWRWITKHQLRSSVRGTVRKE